MSLILALALLAQPGNIDRTPPPDPAAELARWRVAHGLHPDPAAPPGTPIPAETAKAVPPPIPTRADLELAAAVEDFARATPPEPYRSMIAALGSEKWADRDAASKALESAVRSDRSAVRWLFVGRRDADHEIRLRCNTLVRRLHPCPDCKGGGHSKSWDAWPCSECDGAATEWPRTPWD